MVGGVHSRACSLERAVDARLRFTDDGRVRDIRGAGCSAADLNIIAGSLRHGLVQRGGQAALGEFYLEAVLRLRARIVQRGFSSGIESEQVVAAFP